MSLEVKILFNTIENLILLCKNPVENSFYFCGIKDKLIEDLQKSSESLNYTIVKLTKNGIVIGYKHNYIILQKNMGFNSYWLVNPINKPLKELDIIDMFELDDE